MTANMMCCAVYIPNFFIRAATLFLCLLACHCCFPNTPPIAASWNVLRDPRRKVCNHPYLLLDVQPDVDETEQESVAKMVAASGKLSLLDRMLPRLQV